MRLQSISHTAPSAPKRRRRQPKDSLEITLTPRRGFAIALLILGIPTLSLGGICFSLLQNNLHLSQKNNELEDIATEVKAEVDSLGQEIDSLRERAGVPKTAQTAAQPAVQTERAQSSRDLRFKGGPAESANALVLLEDAKQQMPKLNKALDSAVKPALEDALAAEAAYPDGQPVVGSAEVSSEFGIRSNPFGGGGFEVHKGLDFVGEQGDIIAAAGDGVVTLAGHNGGYGIAVTLDHENGYETLYGHMSKLRVQVGDRVKRGQIIGYIGSTGRSSGPHLHFSLYKGDIAIDPRTVLKLPETAKQSVKPDQ